MIGFDAIRAAAERLRGRAHETPAHTVRVDDAAMPRAMRLVWERMKLVVEPSAAVAVVALLEAAVETRDQRIGVILSGGNIDLDRLPWRG
jgi:threonine dehydratase